MYGAGIAIAVIPHLDITVQGTVIPAPPSKTFADASNSLAAAALPDRYGILRAAYLGKRRVSGITLPAGPPLMYPPSSASLFGIFAMAGKEAGDPSD